MKKNLILIALILTSFKLFSQESTFNLGDKVLNIGIGLGSTYYTGLYYHTTVPPISVSGEYGFKDGILEKGVIGLGGYLGYAAYKWEYNDYGYNYGWKYTNFIIGARGSFHYPLVDKLDTYTGLMLGARIVTETEYGDYITGGTTSSASGSGVVLSWYAGCRYYFNDKFAAMAELGYGVSWLTLGISLKL